MQITQNILSVRQESKRLPWSRSSVLVFGNQVRVRFLGRRNPQHAFLRRWSKAVGLMS